MRNINVLPGAIKRNDWIILPSGREAKVNSVNDVSVPGTVSVTTTGATFGGRHEQIIFTLPFVRKFCTKIV